MGRMSADDTLSLAIARAVTAGRADAVRLLRDFVGVPSVTGEEGAMAAVAAAAFAEAGLAVEQVSATPEPWDAHHRRITRTGTATAELDSSRSAPLWASGWKAGRTGVVVGFRVSSAEEVDAAARAVSAAGHRVLQEPHDAFFGARYAVFEDPDGIAVGVMGPIEDSRKWMPKLP